MTTILNELNGKAPRHDSASMLHESTDLEFSTSGIVKCCISTTMSGAFVGQAVEIGRLIKRQCIPSRIA
jgi:hypothetical protein